MREQRRFDRAGNHFVIKLMWYFTVMYCAACAGETIAATGLMENQRWPPIDPDSLVIVSADEQGMATILGLGGCVPPDRWVVIHTIDTDELVLTQADDDGGFRVRVFAPPGAVLQIHHRQRRPPLPELDPDPSASAAVILELGPSPSTSSNESDDRLRANAIMRHELARVWVDCRLSSVEVDPGGSIDLSGVIQISPLPQAQLRSRPDSVSCELELVRLFAADGGQLTPIRLLASSLLTPTGIPVEAPEDISSIHCGAYRASGRQIRRDGNVLRCPLEAEVRLPEDLPAGYYLLGCRVHFDPRGFASARPAPGFLQESQIFLPARLAVIKVGRPDTPRLAVMLLADLVSNGSRGVLPPETERRWAIAPAAVFQTPLTAFPREYRDGSPVTFCFEPGLPLVSLANRPFPMTIPRPLIPFHFAGGSWQVDVRSPSGRSIRMGPSEFVAGRNNLSLVDIRGVNPAREPITAPMAYGNNYLGDVYQLTVADRQEFLRVLEEDGVYTVETSGYVLDRFGHRYDLASRFSFTIARPFDLDLGMFTGTPLTVGESITSVVHVRPPLEAEVCLRLRHFPDSRHDREQVQTVRGRANRFGYFAPKDAPLQLNEPGEYVLDVAVEGRDQYGRLWTAYAHGASIVAPSDPIITAHGERGLRSPDATRRLAWYIEGLGREVVRKEGAGMHALFPYHSGDVLWVEDHESIFPSLRFDDPTNQYADLVERLLPDVRQGTYGGFFTAHLRPIDMRVVGELPLFSQADHHWPIGQFPERATYVSYAYTSTVRPEVAVRSLVHESSFLAYWALDDPYNLQYGAGGEGDLPGDMKLQFGGVVLRGLPDAEPLSQPAFPQYAAYASMAVIVPPRDPLGNRVTPPFRGAGGGPNGGPLLTIRGRDYDLFVTPTGVLPGSVCQVGDRFTYSGYTWPTLPVEVRWTVTGPDQTARSFQTTASRVGYFHDPATDFVLTEPGLYSHQVALTYRGTTSAGPVESPYPVGDLPGSASGLSHFVVVDPQEPTLDVEIFRPHRDTDGPPRPVQYSLEASVPSNWTRTQGWVTVSLPGFLVEDRPLRLTDAVARFDLDAATWQRDFPNIDQHPVDTFVVTVSISGTDPRGQRHTRVRLLVLQGQQVW